MRTIWLVLALAAAAAAQDLDVDRGALEELLAKKKLAPGDFHFDLEHLDSMPANYFAHYSSPKVECGQLKVFRRVQSDPVTFPGEMNAYASRVLKGEVFEAAYAALDRAYEKKALPDPAKLDGLPEGLAGPVGRIVAAIEAKDAPLILAAILAAEPALLSWSGDVDWSGDGMVVTSSGKPENPDVKLWIKFGGDDTYSGTWGGATKARPVCVVIDTGGNDAYLAKDGEAAQGAGLEGGIGILVDLWGNDIYRAEGEGSQGCALGGVGILIDGAGDDRYEALSLAQGSAYGGIGALIDRSGRDRYVVTTYGQGFAGPASFGVLADLSGDDDYHARDPLHGDPVTVPAPQDEKHNANMSQGAAMGKNSDPMTAGGVALLLDARGDDVYRGGCWSQGVGYFQGLGALLDLAGDDDYQAWVYIMGSGAHGGFGLLSDSRGDDVYRVGGWNALAMSVDYGIGFFLDGAGNDLYDGGSSAHGCSIGLGISLFQDSGGDDQYKPKDNLLGHGKFYEKEDYNADGTVTPAEKRHWGIFLDLGGSDRYSNAKKNGEAWDVAEFSGGLDRRSPAPKFRAGRARQWDGMEVDVNAANWEELQPADVFRSVEGDPRTRATFAWEHGLRREAARLTADLPDGAELVKRFRGPGDYEFDAALELWLTADEKKAVAVLKDLKFPEDLSDWKPDAAWPAWIRRAAADLARREAERRQAEPMAKIVAWESRKDVTVTVAKRRELDVLRRQLIDTVIADGTTEKDWNPILKKLMALWSGRKSPVIPVDFADAVKRLDAIDRSWRDAHPLAAANDALKSVTLETLALTPLERSRRAPPPDLSRIPPGPKSFYDVWNDFRAMLAMAPVTPDDDLTRYAGDELKKTGSGKLKEAWARTAATAEKAKSPSDLLAFFFTDRTKMHHIADPALDRAGVAVDRNLSWVVVAGAKGR